jgi:outer membrane protein insertion porin family
MPWCGRARRRGIASAGARCVLAVLLLGGVAVGASAQPGAEGASALDSPPADSIVTPCGNTVRPPVALPPEGSPPFLWILELCFAAQGGVSTIDAETYMYYIGLRPSRPSEGVFVPWDDRLEQRALADFQTLMVTTGFLEDMTIRVTEHVFPNGVIGTIVTYDMEERTRLRIVQYEGTRQIDRATVEERLREHGVDLRIDAWLDEGLLRRAVALLRRMMAEKGYADARITYSVTPLAGGPRLASVRFVVEEGPRIRIRSVRFDGNTAFSDRALRRRIEQNRPAGWLGWIMGGGVYLEAAYEEDAARIEEHYHDAGYARARVGQPEVVVLEDSGDGRTRWVELRVPVTEGVRYQVGDLRFDGNALVRSEALQMLYEIRPGDWFSRRKLMEGNRRAQEIYGAAGFMEFTPFPDLRFSDETLPVEEALASRVPEALLAPGLEAQLRPQTPTVDVTLRVEEGPQYFVHRIRFSGNDTTRDHVIRRELRLVEGGVFDTEALKFSIRRLNQLGYFHPIEGSDRDTVVEKSPDRENAVDITLTVEEQNRNQLTFGAGVSQFDGFFGQLAFQTSNFLGRGESLTLSLQAGSRTQQYQATFTNPYLFGRNMTGGVDVFRRATEFVGSFTQRTTGAGVVFGVPVATFSRLFVNYSLQRTVLTEVNEAFLDPGCFQRAEGCAALSPRELAAVRPDLVESVRRSPFVADALLVEQGGRRTISTITPSLVRDTIDHPIFPSQGTRYGLSLAMAGIGGNTSFYKPRLEGIWYRRHTARTTFGARAQLELVAPFGPSGTLPLFERLFLGGEFSVRGFDVRSIGPVVPESPGVLLGGNTSLLVNGEYTVRIAGPVRVIAFFDAGQVRDVGQPFALREDLVVARPAAPPAIVDPFAGLLLVDPASPALHTDVVGRASAFKTSTGIELRFFMPVLNVPFRLIHAWNLSRAGVLDSNLRPAPGRVFRFAVGTTF